MAGERRIIHVLGALKAGGAERFVVDLVLALRAQGLPVELVVLLPDRDAVGEKWAGMLAEGGVPLHEGPATARLSLKSAAWLARVLKQPDVDLVHVHLHYSEAAYYASRKLHRRRYKVVRTIHNTSLPSRTWMSWAFRRSDIRVSITCGEATEEVYRGRVRGRTVCIPYGVRFDWEPRDPALRDERQRALGLDPSHAHFLHLGRQGGDSLREAQKAHDDLIRAWRDAGLGVAGGRLHLLGDGNLRPQLEALAEGDASIVFHGVQPNAHEWMAACDTFAMPSRWEGLPLAGIEAVGTGIACVFSDIAPLRELGSGVAAFHPVGDTERLGGLMLERVGRRDGASAEEVASMRERFGIESAARRYAEVYDSLDGGGGA